MGERSSPRLDRVAGFVRDLSGGQLVPVVLGDRGRQWAEVPLFGTDSPLTCLLVFTFRESWFTGAASGVGAGVLREPIALASRAQGERELAERAVLFAADVALQVAGPQTPLSAPNPEAAERRRAVGRWALQQLVEALDAAGVAVPGEYRLTP